MESITLQTSDSSVVVNDILGRLGFAASSESDGGDSVLVAAMIKAVAEETFGANANRTSIVFSTANSATADDRLKITSDGHFIPVSGQSPNIGSSTYPFANVYSNTFIKSGGTSSQFLKADGSVDGSTYAKSVGIGNYAAWFQSTGGGDDITYYGYNTQDIIYSDGDMHFQSTNGFKFRTDATGGLGGIGTERLHIDSSEAVFNDGGNNYDFRVEGDGEAYLLQTDANKKTVGIGQSNPDYKLYVKSSNTSLDEDGVFIRGVGVDPAVMFMGADTNESYITAKASGVLELNADIWSGSVGSAITFRIDNSEKMRVDYQGRVGIGVTSPAYKLDVNGDFSANSINVNDQYTFPTGVGSVGDSLVYAGSNQVAWSGVSGGGSLSGNLVGDLNLNNYDIVGTGNITIDGNITAEYFYGDLDGVVITECRNGTAGTISEGTPVYVSGYYSSNGKPLIAEANASSSSTMPAIGLLASDLASGAEGHVHVFGLAQNLPSGVTNGFSVGETVYVAAGGGLTNVRPTGVSELVQNMGRVLKTGTNGRILVLGPGRSNDVPNSGHFEQLTVDGQTILAKDGGNVGVGVSSPNYKLEVDAGSSSYEGVVVIGSNNPTYRLVKSGYESDLSSPANGVLQLSADTYAQSSDPSIRFSVWGEKARINTYGLGIGTTTHTNRLQVEGGNVVFNQNNGSYTFKVGSTASDNLLYVDGTSNDKVGIGTATPQAKLDVNGTVEFDDLVRWEYPDKALDTSTSTLGYMRLHDEANGYAGLGVSTASFNIGTSGAINFRVVTDNTERIIVGSNGNTVINEEGHAVNFRVEGDADENLLIARGAGGTDKVGIGCSPSLGKLHIQALYTNNNGHDAIYIDQRNTSSSNGTYNNAGIDLLSRKLVASGVTDTGQIIGADLVATLDGDGSLNNSYGARTWGGVYINNSGSLTNAWGIQPRVINGGYNGASIANAYGVDIVINGDLYDRIDGNTITTAMGLRIRGIEHAANKWAIYQEGVNDNNYFAGKVCIGTAATPSYNLDVNGTFSANSINVNDQFTFPTTDGSADQVLVTNGSGSVSWQDKTPTLNETVNGRLTLESGEPISVTNQTAKSTLYFTPYKGNQITLYNGTAWSVHSFSELSLSLSGYTANTNYDIFIYDNSGTLTLESTAWTNDATRATSLTTQDGVYVKSGATTRRYIGTIRTTATTGQCEDSESSRFVWNYYNQTRRRLLGVISGSHTYNSNPATTRNYDNNTTLGQGRVAFVQGFGKQNIDVSINNQNKYMFVGLNYNGYIAGVQDAVVHDGTNTNFGIRAGAFSSARLGKGYNYIQAVESNTSAGVAGTAYSLVHISVISC